MNVTSGASTADSTPAAGPGLAARAGQAAGRLPATSYFLTSAVFHYLGPSFAVVLFSRVDVLGVAWMRIASAAVVFGLWRRPWRLLPGLTFAQCRVLLALGIVLAAMNSVFYLAIDRLPLSTVGAIEFLGTVVLAAAGARTRRNAVALALAVGGVAALTAVRLDGEPLGFVFAFANCAGFMLYVVLGHRIASAPAASAPAASTVPGGPVTGGTVTGGAGAGGTGRRPMTGIDRLAAAMLVAAVVASPVGLPAAVPAFSHPAWLLWGVGVGVCSSVIPYVTDQLAMARLPRATFALMLALLPMFATLIGAVVLRQVPTLQDLAGIVLVIGGVALHRSPVGRAEPPPDREPARLTENHAH
jgi:inner membrane transporter RhtA